MSNMAPKKNNGKGLGYWVILGVMGFILIFFYFITRPPGENNKPTKVSQKQYSVSPAQDRKVDVLEEQFALEQERNARTNARIDELERKIGEAYQQNNERIAQNLYNFHQELIRLNQVIDELERRNSQKREVRVVKPKDPPRARITPEETIDKGLKSRGFQVRAVVGERAWIGDDHIEDSVTKGDLLPDKQKPYRIKNVDADSNAVITSSIP